MGCMTIRTTKGFTELWCDGEQDVIDDWIEKRFGKVDVYNEKKCREIFYKIIHNKTLFNQGYNKVKKNFHAEGEPKRDMTLYEFIYHLNFGLGTPVAKEELQGLETEHAMPKKKKSAGVKKGDRGRKPVEIWGLKF